MRIHIIVLAVAGACISLLSSPFGPGAIANPTGVFNNLDGTWRGNGRISLTGGESQRIGCRAYYNANGGGAALNMAIRCASPDNKIELRAQLNDKNGQVSGTWEERTFNATGNVSGTASTGLMALSIDGAVQGSMRISFSGRNQQVSITTATDGLRGIAINLRR